jgi:hypothetical protein
MRFYAFAQKLLEYVFQASLRKITLQENQEKMFTMFYGGTEKSKAQVLDYTLPKRRYQK